MLGAEPVKRADPRAGQRIDPTDPLNYSVVSIRNDTTGPVALNDCKGAYCHVPLPVRLSPGQQFTEGAAFGASGSNMTSWKVTGGTVLGYVAVAPPASATASSSTSPAPAPTGTPRHPLLIPPPRRLLLSALGLAFGTGGDPPAASGRSEGDGQPGSNSQDLWMKIV